MCLQAVLLAVAMEGVDVLRVWLDGEGIYNANREYLSLKIFPSLLSLAFSIFYRNTRFLNFLSPFWFCFCLLSQTMSLLLSFIAQSFNLQ